MKTIFLTFSLTLLVLLSYSHPPKKVSLNYNKSDKTLVIEINHPVKNNEAHFIDRITITVNKNEIAVINLDKQTSLEQETYVYPIGELKSGDRLKVHTSCNKAGSKSMNIRIK